MDPQDNSASTPPAGGQEPPTFQPDSQPAAPTPSQGPAEVTIDFSQGQQAAPQGSSQPGGLGDMPSITSDSPAASPSGPDTAPSASSPFPEGAVFGAAGPMQAPAADQPPATPPAGGSTFAPAQPSQPVASQDPYAPAQPVQPAAAFPPSDTPGQTTGFPAQADQPAQPYGTQGFEPQTGVPAVAPVPAGKADKKTIIILAAVAAVLIIAIATLIFL